MLSTLIYAILAIAVGICIWGVARIIGNFKREGWIKARGENLDKLLPKRESPKEVEEAEETKKRLHKFVEKMRARNVRKRQK